MTIPLKQWNSGDRITAADLNRLTEAIKRATPVAGNGVMVSQSIGGSVISVSKKGGSGASGAYGNDYPYRLTLLKTADHDYVIFKYVDGGMMVGNEKAACMNNNSPTSPDGAWRVMADGYYVTSNVGHVENAEIELMEDGESVDIYAVAFRKPDGYLYYLVLPTDIYTTTAPSVPDFSALVPDGDVEEARFMVGTVKRIGTNEDTGDAQYDITNQAVRSALSAEEGGRCPFEVRVESDGTTLIYLPA
jgi:hypothetical protein